MCSVSVMSKDDLMKATIIEAAQKLFQQFGLAKTTMEDIARSIGKGKSSLYYYYGTKEEIFVAVVEREKDIIFNEIQTAIEKEETAEAKLRVMTHIKYKALRKRMLLYKIAQIDLPDHLCLFKSIGKRYDEIELNVLKTILTEGIEQGEFKASLKQNVNLISKVLANSLKGLHIEMTFGNYSGSAVALIDATIDILANGLKK